MFHAVTLLKSADKAINHPTLLYRRIWHQQSDKLELSFYCISQVMSCSAHKYVYSQATCKLLPKQLLSVSSSTGLRNHEPSVCLPV